MKINMNLIQIENKAVIIKVLRRLAKMEGIDPEFGICRNLDQGIASAGGRICGYWIVSQFFESLTNMPGIWPFLKDAEDLGGWDVRSVWCGLMADAYEHNGEFEVTEEQAAMLRNEISKKVIVCSE